MRTQLLAFLVLAGCSSGRADNSKTTDSSPPAKAESFAERANRLLFGRGVSEDRAKAFALYEQGCQAGELASCRVLVLVPVVNDAALAHATAVLGEKCLSGERPACRAFAAKRYYPAGAESATAKKMCADGLSWACTDAGRMAEDLALYKRACELGDEVGCVGYSGRVDDKQEIIRWSDEGMAAAVRLCMEDIYASCGDVVRKRELPDLELCREGDLTICTFIAENTKQDVDKLIALHTMCVFDQWHCLEAGDASKAAEDPIGARRAYSRACAAASPDLIEDRDQGRACYGASLLFAAGATLFPDDQRADQLARQGCKLGNADACAWVESREQGAAK